ncbi:TraB/GumN family protein [bacterium SCSIO 12741]|nr:TraB/GumN family protein [bacterium SCSIO 12741]
MRTLIATILSALLFTSISLHGQQKHSLLWRVSGNGLDKPSYLFGTIHIQDEEVFQFADSVLLCLEASDAFAMELHPDTVLQGLFTKTLAGRFGNEEDSEDSRLKEVLSEDEYQRFAKKFKEVTGLDLADMNQNNPLLLATMMEKKKRSKSDKETFMDGYLYGIARTYQKPVFGLEELEDQLGMLRNMSDDQLRDQLMVTVDSSENYQEMLRDSVVQLYRNGDVDGIEKLSQKELGKNGSMLKRNEVMVNTIDSLVKKQSLFAAMGAAHLPGKEGVVELLRAKGYKVETVVSAYTGIAEQYKVDPSKIEWAKNRNEEFGFQLETPGKLFLIESVKEIPTFIYPDISTGQFYMMIAMDFRGKVNSDQFDEQQFVDLLIQNFGNSQGELIRKKRVKMNGFDAAEAVIKTKEDQFVKCRFLIRNNVVYVLTVGPEKRHLEGPSVDRFFDSFQSFKSPAYLSSDWEMYSEKKAAFSVQWPKEPETKVTVTPNPIDSESDDYVVYIQYAVDIANGCNYLLRYNDNPSGYYIPDPDVMLEELIKELQANAKLMGTPDTIQIDGYPGRSFNMMLADKYYTRVRAYVRGNRTYVLLAQNLLEGARDFTRDDFFDSFTLEPYATPTFKKRHKPEGEPFEVQLFSSPYIQEEEGDSYLMTMTDIFCTNPMSGGMYQFEYGELHDYFRINNLDTFYHQFARDYGSYSDTIVQLTPVKMGDADGIDVVLGNRFTEKQSRFRYWIDNKKYFFIYSEVSNDELLSEGNDLFFEESYVKTDTFETFDIYASKLEDIYAGLRTSDTIIYNYSMDALGFYEYSEDELPVVYQMLSREYEDDTLDYGARCIILGGIRPIANEATVEFVSKLYRKESTTNEIRQNILLLLDDMEDSLGFEASYHLLMNEPYLDEMSWWIGQPLRDSLPYCQEKWDEILALTDKSAYRKFALDLAETLSRKDSSSHALIREKQDLLFAHINDDLDIYEELAKGEDYYYMSEMNNYLAIQRNITGLKSADPVTQRVIEIVGLDSWMSTLAAQTRIKNGLEVSPKLLKKKFKNEYSRFEMMSECFRAGSSDLIPKKYDTQEEFARMSLVNFIGLDDVFPDNTDLLDTMMVNDSVYYVFSYNFDKTKYYEGEFIGIAGPFAPGVKDYGYEDYPAYTDWNFKEEDWRGHALRLIGEMEEYGY